MNRSSVALATLLALGALGPGQAFAAKGDPLADARGLAARIVSVAPAPDGTSLQFVVDISGQVSQTSCGVDPTTRNFVSLDIGPNAVVTSIDSFSVTLNAASPSWRSEADIGVGSTGAGNPADREQAFFTPFVGQDTSGTASITGGPLAIPDGGATIEADGLFYVSFCETFVDAVNPNATWQANSTLTFSCSNCQVGAPEIGVSPTSLNLGDANVGTTSAAQSFTISNTGTAEGDIAGIGFTGPFARAASAGSCPAGAFSLADGESCTVNVVFQPVAAGAASGSATVDLGGAPGDAPAGAPSTVVNLTGNGTAASIGVAPSSLNFGSIAAGTTSAAQTVTFTNSGNGSGSVDSFSFSGGFSRSGGTCPSTLPFTLTPGQSCTVGVVFTAGVLGPVSGSFTANAGASVLTVALAAASITPAPAFIPVAGGWALALMIALIGLFAGIAVLRRQ